jgi:3-oxoacyl-[acyl-carrier-protein] synthase-3
MNGNVVYRFATQAIVDSTQRVLEAGGWTQDDVDLFVPHQANLRIIESGVARLKFPSERVVITLDRYGNTSSASIPLCLDYAWRTGRLQLGQRLLMMGLGGGLAWGTCLIRWMGEPA